MSDQPDDINNPHKDKKETINKTVNNIITFCKKNYILCSVATICLTLLICTTIISYNLGHKLDRICVYMPDTTSIDNTNRTVSEINKKLSDISDYLYNMSTRETNI